MWASMAHESLPYGEGRQNACRPSVNVAHPATLAPGRSLFSVTEAQYQYMVRASYIEIYNEEIRDLVSAGVATAAGWEGTASGGATRLRVL